MATYDQFFPYIQPYTPGCPENVIEAHLAEAAAQFCAESYIWRTDIAAADTSADTAEYTVTVPANTILEDILILEVEESPIQRVPDGAVEPNYLLDTGQPQFFDIYNDTQIRFFPTPDDTYSYRGTAVVKPAIGSSTGVEDFIFETYGRCIADGAKALLTAIPEKQWSNPEGSLLYQAMFKKGIADARRRDTRSTLRRVAFRSFA